MFSKGDCVFLVSRYFDINSNAMILSFQETFQNNIIEHITHTYLHYSYILVHYIIYNHCTTYYICTRGNATIHYLLMPRS